MNQPETGNMFQCAMCGNCCRGEGFVRISPLEAQRIADYLEISVGEFLTQYTQEAGNPKHTAAGDVWLLDRPGPEQDCIFLENNLCQVNPVKPNQCVGFPMKWRTPDIMDYCVGMQRP